MSRTMEVPKSKSLNILAPSVHVSDADFKEKPSTTQTDAAANADAAQETRDDTSVKSAMDAGGLQDSSQERRLSASLLGDNLSSNTPISHLNLSNTKQYILGTTRINVRTTNGLPLAQPVPQPKSKTLPDAADYNPIRVLEGARNALESLAAEPKPAEGSEIDSNNMGMFYRRTTMSPGGSKQGGSLVGSLVQKFENTQAIQTQEPADRANAETPIFV